MSRINELKKKLGKPEGVAKVWSAEGKKMIFDFEIGVNKVFWEAKLDDNKWSFYVKARNNKSAAFVMNSVLKGTIGELTLEEGVEFPDGRGRLLFKDIKDDQVTFDNLIKLFKASVKHMNNLISGVDSGADESNFPKIYGKIIKGKEFMAFDFTDAQFSQYLSNQSDFKSLLSNHLYPFDIRAGINPAKENLIVISDIDCICYCYNKENGAHPARYQDTEDTTDWVNSDIGVKQLSDVVDNYSIENPASFNESDDDNDVEKFYDAIYISSPTPLSSNLVLPYEDIDWDNIEVSIRAIGFDKEWADEEKTYINSIMSDFNGFQAILSDEGENLFYLCFDSVQIIVDDELIGANLSAMEENGVILDFSFKTFDGKDIQIDYPHAQAVFYNFQVDLSETMDIIESNF